MSLETTSSAFPLLFFLFFGDTVAGIREAESKKITYLQYARTFGRLLKLNHSKDLARFTISGTSYCHNYGQNSVHAISEIMI